MISILSPAKSLTVTKEDQFTKETQALSLPQTTAHLVDQSFKIVEKMQKHTPEDIEKLMSVSKKIAQLNYNRFQNFNSLEPKQALLAFDGDVYTYMDRDEYSVKDFAFAQDHLRILSGLYGILNPMDMIKPYRLEMSTKIDGLSPQGMHKYWQKSITDIFNKQLSEQKNPILINLASNEYSAAINFKELKYDYVNINFLELRNGKLKNIALNSKRARGMCANYIIKNQIDSVDSLLNFAESGYLYNKELSDQRNIFFTRS